MGGRVGRWSEGRVGKEGESNRADLSLTFRVPFVVFFFATTANAQGLGADHE